MATKLSTNFTLEELIEAGSARRLGFDEQFDPSQEVIVNLTKLCCKVLQPLRDAIGHPLRVTSGYRCERLNKAVGGSKTSEHKEGKAADVELWINGENKNQLLFDKVIELGLPFNQMIDEFGTESSPAWIHISYSEGSNKKEKLRARKVNGATVYTKI